MHISPLFMKRMFATATLVLLTLSACSPAAPEETGPIKIGFIGPLTGGIASIGTVMRNAAAMRVKEINDAGGINGRPIELVIEDGKCTGTDAASAAQKLVSVDTVVAIHGGECSGETLAAAPITEAAGIVLLSPISSSPDVSQAGDFVFRNYPSDALKTVAMARYFKDKGHKKIAVISENTDFCMAFVDSLKQEVGTDVEIIFNEVVEPETKDFRSLMTRLKDQEFDIFFSNANLATSMGLMVQQFREQGFTQPILSHDVGEVPEIVQIAGKNAEGFMVINLPEIGAETPFGKKYTAAYGKPESAMAFAAHSYDAISLLAQAIEEVGTDGEAMRDYFNAMGSYSGEAGTFRFDENGDALGYNYALRQIKDGVFVTVEPIAVD